ncbi:MAG TPA: protein kinase [Thermoanaerobaculia bacterium]
MQQPDTLIEGRYEILGKIREGGMGTIYKVRHRLLDEIRVVKVMKPSITADEEMKHRFADEAKMATRLKHPNIGTIHDFALDEDGTAYLVMEFIDGVNLGELLSNKGPPEIPLVLEIAHQALLALGYLHRRNIIHRDVAPDNLMLTHDEEGQPRIKLIDLGIAKALDRPVELTSAGVFLGKLKYASPEQYGALPAGEKLDGRSDLYCLGVVLYELLTGIRPFAGDTPPEMLRAHLFSAPIPFEESDPKGRVPADVRKIILRTLEKKREDRFPTAEDFDREIVEIRHRYGTGGLEQTVQMLSAVRQTPQSSQEQTITPSAQSRLDRQFAGPTTPTAATVGLVPVPKSTGEGKTAVVRAPSRPSGLGRILFWAAAGVIVLAAVGLLLKGRSGSRAPALSTPIPAAPTPPFAAASESRAVVPTTAPTEVPTSAPAPSEPTAPRRIEAPAESGADRAAAEQARRLASRARVSAERVGSEARAAGPYETGRRAQEEGDRLMTQGRFPAARAAYERSADRFMDAQTAVAELLASRPAGVTVLPAPTPRPEPSRAAAVPAEPPPPPLPTAAPAKAGVSDQDRIREVLHTYERAHNSLDVDLYARSYPSFVAQHRSDLERAWQGLRSQRLELDVHQIEVRGSQATVRATQKLTVVPQAGSEQRDTRDVVLKLEKHGDAWVITERT